MPFHTAGDLIAGEYRVVRQLGAGGMAVVYLCTDIGLDSPVAVKVLSDQLMGIPEARERFLQEARTMYRLRHAGIMPVQRVVHQERLAAMVMPYFEGQTLADLMDAVPSGQRAVSEGEALRIFGDLLSAVRFAHESSPSVIHRDLKPDNVYLAGQGSEPRVLLMDFGIAKVLQESAVRTQTGSRMGTVAYMAPEQIQASKSVGVAADIWSLGVVLYELLCGRRPFESDSDLLLAGVVVAAQVPEGPLRGVGEELRAVIHRCLEKDAGARYPSVAALQQAVGVAARGAEADRAREQARAREEARVREVALEKEADHPSVAARGRAGGGPCPIWAGGPRSYWVALRCSWPSAPW